MKIRNGFVSNSSTSSFVCVIERSAFEKEFKKLSTVEQAVVAQFVDKNKTKLATMDIVLLTYYQSDGYCRVERKDLPENIRPYVEKEELYEYVDEFCAKIPKDSKIESWDQH